MAEELPGHGAVVAAAAGYGAHSAVAADLRDEIVVILPVFLEGKCLFTDKWPGVE